MRIPFNKPDVSEAESDYVAQVMRSDKLSGDGEFSRSCEAQLRQILDANCVLLTASGSDALEMAALLLQLQPGDEIIMPSFTFSSTANAFCLRGAKPVFVDIREDTLNLDERLLGEAITERTRAIVPVHYASVACDMDAIMRIAEQRDIRVVEDAAHAIAAKSGDRALGTIGDIGCFSFHDTKTLIAGEGGAIAVNRDDLAQRAEIVREKGTNRSAFIRGEVDKYTWVDIGSSFLPGELTAAVLRAQLERRHEIFRRREQIFKNYDRLFAQLADCGHVRLPHVPRECAITWHMYYLLVSSPQVRTDLLAHLHELGIGATFHYVPLHSSVAGREHTAREPQLPVTDYVSRTIVRLPFFNTLALAEQEEVARAVYSFFGEATSH